MSYTLTYFPMGDRALLIEWPSQIEVEIIEEIWQLRAALSHEIITDYIVAYHSLTIVFSVAQKDFPGFNGFKTSTLTLKITLQH
jgi:allophanate hydrolase subunit 1